MIRYLQKKLKNPVKAIREMCIECMGGRGVGQNYSKLISKCAWVDCAFCDFRFGKNPFRKERPEMSEEQKEKSRQTIEEVNRRRSQSPL